MKTIITIILAFLCLKSAAQDLRCVSEGHYLVENPSGERRVNSQITICYYGHYFSFYTAATGIRTFEISDITTSKDPKGYVIESFMNTENETNMKGDYDISITYGLKKVIVINFTRFGQAYVVESTHFIGSPYENTNTGKLAKRIKPVNISISHDAKPVIDIQQRINDSLSMDVSGDITLLLNIDDNGHVTRLNIQSMQTVGLFSQMELSDKIESILKKAPNWIPAINEKGKYEVSQIAIVIKLNAKKKKEKDLPYTDYQ